MRPKLLPRLLLFKGQPQNRFFVSFRSHIHNNILYRPQLPFLNPNSSTRLAKSQIQIRWLSTERKRWIQSELKKVVKYNAYIWAFGALFFTMAFGIQQEYLERVFHSPSEWSFWSRMELRSVKATDANTELGLAEPNWARQGDRCRQLIKRLENPNIDGAGVIEQVAGGILVEGIGHTGLDVSAKSEPWRRDYYFCIMQAANAAEHLDDWVRDKVRNQAFPANTVIGPSNPNVRPLPAGAPTAPREEDCEAAFEPPETYYMKIITTKGFSPKQRVDAALAYASWLDYKGIHESAREMIRWALDIVSTDMVFDKTGQLNPRIPISSNMLDATTAMALHQARTNNLNMALPLFLSMLRARRSLSTPPVIEVGETSQESEVSKFKQAFSLVNGFIMSAFKTPIYPPAPPDGTETPLRNDRSICEEAALMAYIGEIMFATSATQQGKEEGLAWTREAVDTSEDIIRHLRTSEKDTLKKCKQCLETGFGNWAAMVHRLASQERKTREAKRDENTRAWLWKGQIQEGPGRWESEEAVVRDRMARATANLGLGNLSRAIQ